MTTTGKSARNCVELIGYYGSDEGHALSAWTSTSRELTDAKRARIPELLKMLADKEHHTPFEKSALHFLVTSDIASHIHVLKHRIGVSVNAESARYKELKDDKFYVPVDWPGEEREAFFEEMAVLYKRYHSRVMRMEKWYLEQGYDEKKARSRAKESARLGLPYANQIVQDVQFNFRSFMHFLHLRLDPHAQVEIQHIACAMLDRVRETGAFNHSLSAFGY